MSVTARVADVEVIVAALLSFAFAALYTRSDWRSTRPGRSVMYLILALASVLTLGAITSCLGEDWPGRQHTRAVVFGALIVTLVGMLTALHQAQRRR